MTALITMGLALLYVLSGRGVRALGKHKKEQPAVAVHEPTFVPAAEGYLAAFNAVQEARTTKNEVLLQGRAAIERLVEGVRSWFGVVLRDLPDFELDVELDRRSPDRVLAYTEALLTVIEKRRDRLPYAAALIEQVGGLLELARADWERAQEVLGELQTLQRTLRERGVVVSRELVALRRTLRNVLGSSHRDYQLLRARRAAAEVDELEVEPVQPEAQPIAPSNGAAVTPPRA